MKRRVGSTVDYSNAKASGPTSVEAIKDSITAKPSPKESKRSVPKSESDFIVEALAHAENIGLSIDSADLVFLHLAAKVRPFILLAGPSGAGKTTLARFYAKILGSEPCKVAVQAHWTDDRYVVGETGLTKEYTDEIGQSLGVVLFDELNLTRPEYYLSQWVQAIDDPAFKFSLPRTLSGNLQIVTMGTMNIDEWSRPPPDKILDRAFLLELRGGLQQGSFSDLAWQPSPHFVDATCWDEWCQLGRKKDHKLPEEIRALFESLRLHCDKHGHSVHETLQPSRRTLRDACHLFAQWEKLDEAKSWLPRAQLLDRIVSSRILPKFRGTESSMRELLEDLKKEFNNQEWVCSRRHVEVMARQLESGFASFWG